MKRVNRVVDNILAILRKEFVDDMDGGSEPYNPNTSNPPSPIQDNPLCWDVMIIDPESADIDDGKDTGDFDDDGNPMPDTRDTVSISVHANTDTARATSQSHRSFPATRVDIAILILVAMKDGRWNSRLQNALAGRIEKLLWRRQTLAHPDTGEEAANAVNYENTEVNTDTSEDTAFSLGVTIQEWTVDTKPN